MEKGKGMTVAVVAPPNKGKTQWIIDEVEKSTRPIYVYDKRLEYDKRLSSEALSRTTIFYQLENFTKNLLKFKYSNIIGEEASTWLRWYSREKQVDLLSGIYHNGNLLYLPFHVVRLIPPDVYDFCNFIRFYSSGEDIALLKRSRPKLYQELSKPGLKFPYMYVNQEFVL